MNSSPPQMRADSTPHKDFMQKGAEYTAFHRKHYLRRSRQAGRCATSCCGTCNVVALQTSLTAVANETSVIGERLARWLIMCQDSVSHREIHLTHEFPATMLEVRRPRVTEAVNVLEGKGLKVDIGSFRPLTCQCIWLADLSIQRQNYPHT